MSETNAMDNAASAGTSNPAPAPVSTPTGGKSNTSMMMGILLLLILLVAGGAAAFFLMQEEDSDSDSDDTEEADEEEEDEEESDEEEDEDSDEEDEDSSSDMEEYDGDFSSLFTFEYPGEFVVEDEGTVSGTFYTYIYAKDPDELGLSDFNPNVNITSAGFLEMTEAEADYCEEYATEVVDILADSYDAVELVDHDNTTVNGLEACKLVLEGTYFGVDLIQEQYLIFNEDEDGESFIATLTTNMEEEAYDELIAVIDSIEVQD